jgi:hypothetical protein
MFPHEDGSGRWVVEGIELSFAGEFYRAVFSGSEAERRAREYCEWQSQSQALAA